MRDPASPNGGKDPEIVTPPGQSGVSIPDRRRIDSDVRAFLREPSTPWIVFDREGRPPSQLAVGEMLSVPRRTVLSLSDANFFPATAIIDGTHPSAVEPSSLALASDLTSEDEGAPGEGDVDADAASIPMFAAGRRVIGASAAGLALVAMLAVGTLVLRSASTDHAAKSAASSQLASQVASPAFGAAVPAEIPPPDLDVRAPAPVAAPESAPASPGITVVVPRQTRPVKASAKKFARLSIGGEARSRDVFMDGKRMLGRGARSFTILCGSHTIAVGQRSDVREIDVPCTGNAELVVSK